MSVSKKVLLNVEAKTALIKGANIVADAVKSTLGPKGGLVAIENSVGQPHLTKDGVSVAANIFLEDPVENLGAQIIKQVSSKTATDTGDGTTTATILAQKIINSVDISLPPAELNWVKKGIDAATDFAINHIQSNISAPCSSADDLLNVATISANGDTSIGKIAQEAITRVGLDGIVRVEQGSAFQDSISIQEGYHVLNGYVSPFFVGSNSDGKASLSFDNPLIVSFNDVLSRASAIVGAMEIARRLKRPLVIFADDIQGEALSTLLTNKEALPSVAIRQPGYGSTRKVNQEDLLTVVGATLISDINGSKTVSISDMGGCARIVVDPRQTIIFGGQGGQDAINNRIANIRAESNTLQDCDAQKALKERIALLSCGIATIYVATATYVDMREKADRIDDALCATRAALRNGIVPGGGETLKNAAGAITENIQDLLKSIPAVYHQSFKVGVDAVIQACNEPFFLIHGFFDTDKRPTDSQIFLRADDNRDTYNRPSKYLNDIRGVNVRTNTVGYLKEMGVIDPTQVATQALRNAASAASLLLSTNCSITKIPDRA